MMIAGSEGSGLTASNVEGFPESRKKVKRYIFTRDETSAEESTAYA
jgi:hypothetical protein